MQRKVQGDVGRVLSHCEVANDSGDFLSSGDGLEHKGLEATGIHSMQL